MTANKPEPEQGKKLQQIIKEMKLADFIETFLYLWDSKEQEYMPWVLWPKQHEICDLLDKVIMLFWPKARQVGGSQIAAAKAVKVAMEEPNCEIYIVSKNERKARSFFKKRVMPLLNALPGKGKVEGIKGVDWGDWVAGTDKVVFSNGTTLACIPTEDDAARGETARLIIMDEAGTMQHAGDIWKAASPAIEQHFGGQIVVISNSKAGSWFNNMVKKIREGKTLGIVQHFMSLWTDPKRTPEWKAIRQTQFDNDVDFKVEYPETLDDMFLKREGHVYPTFDAQEDGRHVNQFDPEWSHPLIYGYDHGFDHFAVFLFMVYDKYHDHLYVFDEIFATQKDTYEVSGLITERIEQWENEMMPKVAWKRIADSAIFAERGQKTVAEQIRVYTGLTFTKSYKYDEEGSTNLLRGRFTRNQISIHPRCQETIRQIRDLMFAATGKAIDKDNDAPDVLRYICAELRKESKPAIPKKKRHYNRDGRGGNWSGPPQGKMKANVKDNEWMVC